MQASLASKRPPRALTRYEFALGGVVMAGLGYLASTHQWAAHDWELAFWVVVVASAELLPVPGWGKTLLTISLPIHMAIVFLFGSEIAAIIAFLGSFDPREFTRGVTLSRAIFNRSQLAISVFVAGLVFHSMATLDSPVGILVPAALAAAVAYELTNASLVAIDIELEHGTPLAKSYRQLAGASLSEFLFFYVGLGLLGIPLAKLYVELPSGEWAIVFFLLPLLLARQMFSRSQALESATQELRSRERVLRLLSNRMAEERYDERKQIAAYLHDDLAQMLFRLGLQADTARSQLEKGNQDRAVAALDNVEEIKDDSVKLVRGLIRDLDRSPIGPAGLATALSTLASDLSKDGEVRFQVDVADMDLPAPIQLLAYQIAREAAQNAVKHASPANIWITLEDSRGAPVLRVRDDGSGFDSKEASPEGHYGLSIMRERAQLGGGTLEIDSSPGAGTEIRVRFLSDWVENGQGEATVQGETGASAQL